MPLISAKLSAYALVAAGLLVLALGALAWRMAAERDSALQAQARAEAVSAMAIGANTEWETLALRARAELNTCQGQWATAQQQANHAAAQAEQGRQQAQRALADFTTRYAARSLSCGEALAALDTACAQLEGY